MSDFQGSVMFCSFHFWFLVFGHFWQRSYKNMKLFRNLCLHFARQNGQDGKKRQENHATKLTKIPKTKRRKYGMNEALGSGLGGIVWLWFESLLILRDKNSKYAWFFFYFRTLIIGVWLWNMISLDIIEKYFPWFLCINWFTMGWNLFWWCNIFMSYFSSIEIATVNNWQTDNGHSKQQPWSKS